MIPRPPEPLSVAIIGTGGIARSHARAYHAIPQARLAAVCDLDREKAEAFAQECDVPTVYGSAAELFADCEIAAASICVPHPQHCPLVVEAAAAGKHVITEKPIASDLADADRALAAAQAAGIKFGVIFQRRFWPAAQRLRAALDAGKLGRLILGDCLVKWSRSRQYYEHDAWRGRWDTEGGGVLLNQAVHAIDMFQWYLGEVESVYGLWANLSHPFVEVEDCAVAALKFRSGALGVISASVSQQPSLWSRITVHGDHGASASVAEIPEGAPGINDIWTIAGEADLAQQWREQDLQTRSFPDCHTAQLTDFLQAIIEDRDPAVTGREGRKSLEIIQAIYQSGTTGMPVRLPIR